MNEERERFFSRLATIPGIRTMPSIGEWILLEVDHPQDLARKINRRMDPGTVSVPRHVPGTVRLPVRDPKDNEALYQTVREIMVRQIRHRYYQELRKVPAAQAR
jgi:histidinol-phosphate/aromatic aminotransferase/cobyric acid decarboxylase-like protein